MNFERFTKVKNFVDLFWDLPDGAFWELAGEYEITADDLHDYGQIEGNIICNCESCRNKQKKERERDEEM